MGGPHGSHMGGPGDHGGLMGDGSSRHGGGPDGPRSFQGSDGAIKRGPDGGPMGAMGGPPPPPPPAPEFEMKGTKSLCKVCPNQTVTPNSKLMCQNAPKHLQMNDLKAQHVKVSTTSRIDFIDPFGLFKVETPNF